MTRRPYCSRQPRQLRLIVLCGIFLVTVFSFNHFGASSNFKSKSKYSSFLENDFHKPQLVILGKDEGEGSRDRRNFDTDRDAKVGYEKAEICRIPKLDINGSEIIGFYRKVHLSCANKKENWAYIDSNRQFQFYPDARKKYGDIECTLQYLSRIDDAKVGKTDKSPVKEGDVIVSDFCEVECVGSKGYSWHHPLMTVVPNRTRIEELKKIKQPSDWSGLDVYFIGFDSLSQMGFRRNLPKTVKFIEETMEGVVLNGYNIVGDGTPQAVIPILTGQTEEQLPLTRKRFSNARYLDEVYPLLLKNFSAAGYVTMFAEDTPSTAMFTYRLKGFKDQPSDHYPFTYFILAEGMYGSNVKCLGSEPAHKEWFRYTGEFMQRYAGIPRFLFAFHGALSHDDINLVQIVDEDLKMHLQSMHESPAFENTVVIIMADHGNRFDKIRATHQGQLEERLPFFSISLPERFRKTERGRLFYENLQKNKDRLSTPFDIHATLLDILHLPTNEQLVKPSYVHKRSLSLFRPISENRTCAVAGIEPHWCTCLNWESAISSEQQKNISLILADLVVDAINKFTESERNLCAILKLKELMDSRRLVPHESLLKYKAVKDADGFVPDLSGDTEAVFAHYQLKFSTTPGDAIYEATVKFDLIPNIATVDMTAISHINKYGDLPHCVGDKNYFLRPYCVCNDMIKQ